MFHLWTLFLCVRKGYLVYQCLNVGTVKTVAYKVDRPSKSTRHNAIDPFLVARYNAVYGATDLLSWSLFRLQEVKHYVLRSRNSLVIFGIRKNCLTTGRSLLLYQFTRVIKLALVIILGYHCYQLHNKILSNVFSRLSPYIDEISGNHQYGIRRNRSTTDQIFCNRQIREKK
jgi:hypothetical protein